MSKRILSVLSVAVLMAVMVAVAALPALAVPGGGGGQPTYTCEHPSGPVIGVPISASLKHLFVKEGYVCVRNT